VGGEKGTNSFIEKYEWERREGKSPKRGGMTLGGAKIQLTEPLTGRPGRSKPLAKWKGGEGEAIQGEKGSVV